MTGETRKVRRPRSDVLIGAYWLKTFHLGPASRAKRSKKTVSSMGIWLMRWSWPSLERCTLSWGVEAVQGANCGYDNVLFDAPSNFVFLSAGPSLIKVLRGRSF